MSGVVIPPGDPQGRRLARQSSQLLAEAGRVARVLEVLLKRAGCDSQLCSETIKEIHKQEAAALQRSYGRIEPRNRFKTHTPRSILVQRSRSVLHIDESGKSNPETLTPPRPTYFSLAAITMPEEKIDDYKVAANEIKLRFFRTTDITLHEPHMRERRDWFALGGDTVKQAEFDDAINELLEKADFQVFGVGTVRRLFDGSL